MEQQKTVICFSYEEDAFIFKKFAELFQDNYFCIFLIDKNLTNSEITINLPKDNYMVFDYTLSSEELKKVNLRQIDLLDSDDPANKSISDFCVINNKKWKYYLENKFPEYKKQPNFYEKYCYLVAQKLFDFFKKHKPALFFKFIPVSMLHYLISRVAIEAEIKTAITCHWPLYYRMYITLNDDKTKLIDFSKFNYPIQDKEWEKILDDFTLPLKVMNNSYYKESIFKGTIKGLINKKDKNFKLTKIPNYIKHLWYVKNLDKEKIG